MQNKLEELSEQISKLSKTKHEITEGIKKQVYQRSFFACQSCGAALTPITYDASELENEVEQLNRIDKALKKHKRSDGTCFADSLEVDRLNEEIEKGEVSCSSCKTLINKNNKAYYTLKSRLCSDCHHAKNAEKECGLRKEDDYQEVIN